MTLPAVSKHLKVLERAGLISRGRVAQSRPCRLEAGPLRRSPIGWTNIAASGSRASIAWMSICTSFGGKNEDGEQ